MTAAVEELAGARTLDRVFSPRSIAVVGASASAGKAGNSVLRHLVDGSYAGKVWPVNPRGGSYAGREFWPSFDALPEAPDLVFLAVPAAATEEALAACAARGAGAAIVGASGFGEAGTGEGRARQRRLVEIAQAAGMRLIGPNTNGLVSAPAGLALGFNRRFPEGAALPGPVSVVSHSGALFDAAVLPLHRAGTGIARFLAAGNEADVTLTEALDWLVDDPETRVIGVIVEALTDAERFRSVAARAAAAGKRIVALKVGRSAAGASAALAHSSRIAGSARAYAALFAAAGVTAVPSIESFAAALTLLARFPNWTPAPAPLTCVTTSGAGGALLADAASDRGLPLAGGSDGALLTGAGAAPIRHPIDLGTLGDWSPLGPVLSNLAPAFPGPLVAFAHTPPSPAMSGNLLTALAARRASVPAPVAVVSPGGLPDAADFADAGLPVFPDTGSLMDALAALCATEPAPDGAPAPAVDPVRRDAVARQLGGASGAAVLGEVDSMAILSRMGLTFAESRAAADPDEAAAAAAALGFPVVLKGQAEGVAHKAEAGLVRLDLGTEAEVREAAVAMVALAGEEISFLVQQMHRAAVELLVAVTHDPQLGPFLMFGPGGSAAETSGETRMLPWPAAPAAIARAIGASPAGDRLRQRLGPAADAAVPRLVAMLEGVGLLAAEQGGVLKAAEVNPVIVTATGDCFGADALIELTGESS